MLEGKSSSPCEANPKSLFTEVRRRCSLGNPIRRQHTLPPYDKQSYNTPKGPLLCHAGPGAGDRAGAELTIRAGELLSSVQECKTGELRFRALVAEGSTERLELTRG